VRLVRQLSGSRVSRLLSRCSCVNVVSRQTERGTCANGLLMMLNCVRWPYVWLLDSSESSCFDSSSRSICPPPWQSTVSTCTMPLILGVQLQLVGHDALLMSVDVATKIAKTNKSTNLSGIIFHAICDCSYTFHIIEFFNVYALLWLTLPSRDFITLLQLSLLPNA